MCGVTHEHPLAASVHKVSWKGNQVRDILSWLREGRAVQKELTFQDYRSSPFNENHLLYTAGILGCWLLGFFNVGIKFLLPVPQTDLFLILNAIIHGIGPGEGSGEQV